MATRPADTDYDNRDLELLSDDLDDHRLIGRGRRAPRSASPAGSLDWRQSLGGALVGLGFIGTVIAWYGVSGTLDPGEQMPYITSGGFGGAALIAVGVTLLVAYEHSRDRAALADVLDELGTVRAQLDALALDVRMDLEPALGATGNGPGRRPIRTAKRSSSS